ncbi:MAG: hypothetical protein LBU34_01530 [Planctomycetaceae bacterium]|nr:hypothetical protein [Planctomycetaceae bacterium]
MDINPPRCGGLSSIALAGHRAILLSDPVMKQSVTYRSLSTKSRQWWVKNLRQNICRNINVNV